MKKKGKARKPRPFYVYNLGLNPVLDRIILHMYEDNAGYTLSRLKPKEARRLSAWLIKAAEYLESRDE